MKEEKQIIIATHGELAKGFQSALKVIVGEFKNLRVVSCYTTSDFDLDEVIENIMIKHPFDKEDLIVCTDMIGGSVNNGFVKYLEKYSFHLVTNINLAFLVDLLLTPGGVDELRLISKVSDEFVSVKYVNQCMKDLQGYDDL